MDDLPLQVRFPRLFALELNQDVSIANKLRQASWRCSFRRAPMGGADSE